MTPSLPFPLKSDKVVLFSRDSKAIKAFYEILEGKLDANDGKFEWGITTKRAFLPSENDSFFQGNTSLIDWLRQYSKSDEEKEEVFIRGFLGKMLFSGDEALKNVSVLSGGEKVRCMLSKVMMEKANVLLINEPTNHLDLESITAFNNSLKKYRGMGSMEAMSNKTSGRRYLYDNKQIKISQGVSGTVTSKGSLYKYLPFPCWRFCSHSPSYISPFSYIILPCPFLLPSFISPS